MRPFHQMDYVSLTLIMGHQSSLTAAVLREDAELVLKQHSQGELPRTLSSLKLRCRADVMGFSVASEHIQGVFIAPAPPMHGSPVQQPFGLPPLMS